MDFIFKVDPIRRNIKVPDAFTVLTMDHNIHKLVFVCPYYEDFAFDSASIVFMIDAPDGRQYSIPAEEYESFPNSPSPCVKFTLTLKSYITSVVGYMSFCITADIISSGNVIEKSWHSKNITISIGGHINNDDSEDIPEEDVPTINQRLNNLDSKVGRLQTTVNGMANGSPTPVETIAEMTDESAVYLYTGSETGYTAGNWYYYNGAAWTSGGTYGGAVTSTTFNQHGVPADDFAVGQALALKADADDVTAIDDSIGDLSQLTTTAKDNLVSAINETDGAIAEINERLVRLVPIAPIKTQFFENLNYGDPANVTFYSDRYPNNDGKIVGSNTTSSLVVNVHPNTTYYMYVPGRNRQIVIESDGNFEIGETYTKLIVTTKTSYNGTLVLCFTTGATATNIMVYIYAGTYDYATNKNNIIITENEFLPDIQPTIKRDFLPKQEIEQIEPKDTTFFTGLNYFSPNDAVYYTDRSISNSTYTINASTTAKTLVFPVRPSTTYYLHIPNPNRGVIVESENNDFYIGTTHTPLYTGGSLNIFTFTTGANANYVAVYFATGDYDYEANKDSIVLNIGEYIGNASPRIAEEYLPDSFQDNLAGTKVLIFGDSITDTCTFTIDSSDQTETVSWKNPSNSYVNEYGTTISYSMWPKILKNMGLCTEIRNYAKSGASYKNATREQGNERQNVSYQITVALNDLSNPNNAFEVDDFVPDIVIFALGTNDGTPNDTYDSAMAKTILKADGYSIDVDATLANLDLSKFCEAVRSAFLRTRVAFPYAQFFCVLPIQRANNEVNGENLNTYLSKMAKRYGCVVIDGFAESGIIRDTNTWNALGITLKDGLHPNEKGQNMMARMIISSLRSHYMPFGTGFN